MAQEKSPFEEEYKDLLQPLTAAYDAIDAIQADNTEHVKRRLLISLKRDIDSLTTQQNLINRGSPTADFTSVHNRRPERKPLTKVLGYDILQAKKTRPHQASGLTPTQQLQFNKDQQEVVATSNAGADLKAQVTALYPEFVNRDNNQLLDEYQTNDVVIRGVAKRAGLPVTEDNPKVIDTKFIDQVKDAIKKQQDKINKQATAAAANDANIDKQQ